MHDNYHYPWGADNEDAPWNDRDMPEREFELGVTVTLSRTATVYTQNYCSYRDDEDGHLEVDTSDTEWEKEYENSHYTIPELLAKLKEYINADMHQNRKNKRLVEHLKDMLEECDSWSVDDTEYENYG